MAQAICNRISPSNRSRSYIDELAERVANKIGCNPGSDLTEIVEKKLGGKVRIQNLAEPEKDGSIVVEGEGKFTIYLSPYISRLRNRFTVAHELGHYFLHSVMGEEPLRIDREGEGREEWEADWFAMGLLMPEREFREAARELHTTEELASRFDVSLQMVETRMESLGL